MMTAQCKRCSSRFDADEPKTYCARCNEILFNRWMAGACIGFIAFLVIGYVAFLVWLALKL